MAEALRLEEDRNLLIVKLSDMELALIKQTLEKGRSISTYLRVDAPSKEKKN